MYVLYLHSMHGCLYTLFLCMIWTNVAHSDLDTPEWVLLLCDSAFTHPSLYIAELYSVHSSIVELLYSGASSIADLYSGAL